MPLQRIGIRRAFPEFFLHALFLGRLQFFHHAVAQRAGIRAVMITGDYKDTAVAIANDLGMMDENSGSLSGAELDKVSDEDFQTVCETTNVYARVSPDHKVRIVTALKNNDFEAFLKNVKASGDSSYKFLQNVYTTHDVLHQNVSIALCMSEKLLNTDDTCESSTKNGVSRVHGGGFAGTIQAFVRNEKVSEYRDALDNIFGEGACAVLKIRKYGGIRVI